MLQGYDDARDHVFSAVEPDDIVRVWQPVQPMGALVAVLYMAEDGLAKLQQGPVGECVAMNEGCMGSGCIGRSVPAAQSFRTSYMLPLCLQEAWVSAMRHLQCLLGMQPEAQMLSCA